MPGKKDLYTVQEHMDNASSPCEIRQPRDNYGFEALGNAIKFSDSRSSNYL